jgi:hypothetical protein
MTSRLNEPPTSLSKITKNVNDYLDKTDSKKLTTTDGASKSDSKSTSTSTTLPPPPPPAPSTSKPETKAQFLDSTDPNETGRNVAQIVFEQEGEDEIYKKFTKSNAASSSTSNTDSSNTDTASSSTSNTDSSNTDTASSSTINTDSSNTDTTKSSSKTTNNQ